MAGEAVVTTLQEIYANGPYSNYKQLRIDLENVNKPNLEKEQKFDITHSSPLSAARKKGSESQSITVAKDDEAYGIVLRVDNSRGRDINVEIYIDVPVAKNTKPVEHPDYFYSNNFDKKQFEHTIFKADGWHIIDYDYPTQGCIARIKLDPNFPASTRYNKYLGMVNYTRVYEPDKDVSNIEDPAKISSGDSAAEEAEQEARKDRLLTEEDIKSMTSLYYSLTMGQGKNNSNSKISSIKKEAVENLIELNETFRLQAASLFNLAWENGLQIGTVSELTSPEGIANLYINGRFCKETDKRKYLQTLKLPFHNASDLGCAINFVGLDLITLKSLDKKRFPYNSLFSLAVEKGIDLPQPNKDEPTLWVFDEDRLEFIRKEYLEKQKLNTATLPKTIQELLTTAITSAFADGVELLKSPNVSESDRFIIGGFEWYDYLYRNLTQ